MFCIEQLEFFQTSFSSKTNDIARCVHSYHWHVKQCLYSFSLENTRSTLQNLAIRRKQSESLTWFKSILIAFGLPFFGASILYTDHQENKAPLSNWYLMQTKMTMRTICLNCYLKASLSFTEGFQVGSSYTVHPKSNRKKHPKQCIVRSATPKPPKIITTLQVYSSLGCSNYIGLF